MNKSSILNNKISTQFVRWYGKHNKKFIYKDGKQYEGITYYPRDSNAPEPQIEPSKLLRVERVKPYKGNPFWEKRIMRDLGIDVKLHDVAVVKNIPENNARLWKIKHLVKITPITFPYGEPTKEDIAHTVLLENGSCVVHKKLKVAEERIEATNDFQQSPARLDGETLRRDTRLKWLNNW